MLENYRFPVARACAYCYAYRPSSSVIKPIADFIGQTAGWKLAGEIFASVILLKMIAPLDALLLRLTWLGAVRLPLWLAGMLGLPGLAVGAGVGAALAARDSVQPGDVEGEGNEQRLKSGGSLLGNAWDKTKNLYRDHAPAWAPGAGGAPATGGGDAGAGAGKDTPAGGGAGQGDASRSFKNNNPGNIKYGKFAKSQGATGKDEKGFAIFPNETAGAAAQRALWERADYVNASLDEGLGKWSLHGYDAAKLGFSGSQTFGGMSEDDKKRLLEAQKKAEGWFSGAQSSGAGGAAGKFSFMHGQFGEHGDMAHIHEYTTASGRRVMLNDETAKHMIPFLNGMEKLGMPYSRSGNYDSYNNREIRGREGTGHWSQHAYANAVDLEARGFTSTPEFTKWQNDHLAQIRELEKQHGIKWGGDMRRRDTPHYEWGGGAESDSMTKAQQVLMRMRKKPETNTGLPPWAPASGVTMPNYNASPLGQHSSWHRPANQVAMNQNTEIHVHGVDNPQEAAQRVGRHQTRVNSDLLKNTMGAIG